MASAELDVVVGFLRPVRHGADLVLTTAGLALIMCASVVGCTNGAQSAAGRSRPQAVPMTEAPLCGTIGAGNSKPLIAAPPTQDPVSKYISAISETTVALPNGDAVTIYSGSVGALDGHAQRVSTSEGLFLVQTLNFCHLERNAEVFVRIPGGHGPTKIVGVAGQTLDYLSADGTSGQLDVETKVVS